MVAKKLYSAVILLAFLNVGSSHLFIININNIIILYNIINLNIAFVPFLRLLFYFYCFQLFFNTFSHLFGDSTFDYLFDCDYMGFFLDFLTCKYGVELAVKKKKCNTLKISLNKANIMKL
jgi:hypothetical protein